MLAASSTRPWVHDPCGRPAHTNPQTRFPRSSRTARGLAATLALCALAACAAPSFAAPAAPTQYTITATAGSGGATSPSGDVVVTQHQTASFTFTPDACMEVADVVVDGVSQGASSSYDFVNVTADHTIDVSFRVLQHSISKSAGSGGTVSPPGVTAVDCGSDLTVDITAANCWAVDDVQVDGVSVGAVAQYTFTNVTADHTLDATFQVPTFTLNGSCGGNGTIVPNGALVLNCGEQRTYNMIPDDCYTVADVLVDGVSVGAVTQYTFNDVRTDHTIVASFSRIPYTIDTTVGGGGSVTPGGTFSADCGSDVPFTITAAACFHIADVTVDGVSIGAQPSYTLYNVRSDHSIEATFALDQYTIDTSNGANGSITPSGSVVVNCGDDQAFGIVPDACYRITDVQADGVSVGAVTSYTFTNVQAAHTLNATFQILTHDVTATAGAGGSISPSGLGAYPCGTDAGYTITPQACYSVASVLVDGVPVGAVTSYTFTGIAADHTIAATFQNSFPVTASAGAGGSVSHSGTTLVGCHANQGFTITADACYAIADVVVDGVSVGATGLYAFTDVTMAHTLSATFTSTAQATTAALSANPPSPTTCMQPVTLIATMTPSNATGTVEFFADGQSLGSAPVISGTASFDPEPPTAGTYTLHAVFTPSGCFTATTSPDYVHTATPATAVITLGTDASPSQWGGDVTITAQVSPSTATGTVTFKDSVTTIGTAVLNNGTCSIHKSNFTTGGHSLKAVYAGDDCFVTQVSNVVSQIVGRVPTTVSLGGDANPVQYGHALVLTAQVAPTGVTGRVTFLDNGSPIGTGGVNSLTGVATLSASNLAPGIHSLTASYPGDVHYQPSTVASSLLQFVQQANPALTLDHAPASPVCGEQVTITASLDAADATGTVEFSENGQSLGSAAVTNGTASITHVFAAGPHDITASYDGDGYHNGATTLSPSTVTVGLVPVTVTLTGGANPSTWSQSVSLSATLSPASAGGTITFRDSLTTLGTMPVNAGAAGVSVSTLQPGRHGAITATYSGDGCNGPSTSSPLSQLVTRAATTVTVAADVNPSTFGETVKLTATVAPAGGTNRVQFYVDDSPIGSAAVNVLTGLATLNVSNFLPGMHMVTATYAGDVHYAGCATAYGSAVLIDRAAAPVSLSATPDAHCGDPVVLTATVGDAAAGGSVEFFEGATSLGSAGVSGGSATHSVTFAVGAHTVTAHYSGDDYFSAATTSPAAVTVAQATPVLQLTANQATLPYGQPVTLNATLSPWTGTGSVTFYDSLTALGTVTLVNGTAAIAKANLPVGVHTAIRATYSGDACYATATSTDWQQSVTRAPTTLQLVSDLNPSTYAQNVKLTAVLTPAGGTSRVKFYDDGNLVGSAAVDALTGMAVLNVATLPPGSHTLTASYAGDRNYDAASTAYNLVQFIDPATASLSLDSDVQTAMCGQVITLTATVSPGDACGNVEFFDDGASLGSSPVLTGGIATMSVKELVPGTHTMTAMFSGCVAYANAQSQPLAQAIIPNPLPEVAIGWPNGGEVLTLGAHSTLTWNATDNTTVLAVKLELSRDNGANWETIVASTANSGSYDWLVTGPGTNVGAAQVYSALLRAVATDDFGGDGVDVSDQPFALYDPLVAVVITELVAQPVDGGIRVRWAISDHAVFTSLVLERAATAAGPWTAVATDMTEQSGATVATDRNVEPGATYWYRLVGTTSGGREAVYGPVSGTAAAPREFALSAVWPNPTRGPLAMVFSVPRTANVHLGVVDLQGREVAVLADGAYHAGRFQVSWDGRTDRGPVPAGLYFVRFTSPEKTVTSRVAITH